MQQKQSTGILSLVIIWREYMAGNENLVVEYLINNINNITLEHIGQVREVQNPESDGKLKSITSIDQIKTENANKKADIYLNGYGISIKQSGASFSYNRIQRAHLVKRFKALGLSDSQDTLSKLDSLINGYHSKEITDRDQHWSNAFSEKNFKVLLKYLMMKGSLIKGDSQFPVDYILTAPAIISAHEELACYTFEEYFEKNKKNIYLTLRRQWLGQASKSENSRAAGLIKKVENTPWCFSDVVGEPRTGWKTEAEFPSKDRQTVYMIYIQTK